MAATNSHSPDLPHGGRVVGAGHHRPTASREAPSDAHGRPSSPTTRAVAEPAITVVMSSYPPRLTPEAAVALMRILLRATGPNRDASPSEPGGGRTSGAPAVRQD